MKHIDWFGIMFIVFLTITVTTCIYSASKVDIEREKTKQLELMIDSEE